MANIDMNNQNSRFESVYDADEECRNVKLAMGNHDTIRREPGARPISESTLNMFACIIAAAIATFALAGLAIALIVLAFK